MMTACSVTEARNRLPGLIDKAIEAEHVVITRHGKPAAKLRPTRAHDPQAAKAANPWRRTRRDARKAIPITAVELLRQLYEDE